MNTSAGSVTEAIDGSTTFPVAELRTDIADNPIIQRALRRLKESQTRANHVSHHTKHSSYSTKHSSTW